jgi:hypothetical protein
MAIKDGFLYSKTDNLNLDFIMRAEIHIDTKNDTIVHSTVVITRSNAIVPYRDDIESSDIEPLEDYFIDNNIVYCIIYHRN